MDKISRRLGYVLTYEDPRYEYADDLVDATSSVRPNGPAEPRLIRPKGGKLELSGISMPLVRSAAAVTTILEHLLALQSEANSGGRFRLLTVGNTFHVVPASVRSKAGRWVDQTSVLDAKITIPDAQRTVREMVAEICKEVSLINAVKVAHMDPAFGSYLTQTVDFGAYNETARDVLLKTLAATGNQMSWRLDYMPGQGWTGYFLTFSQLPKAPQDSAATAEPAKTNANGSLTPMGPRKQQ